MPLNCVVQREQGMAALSPLLALAYVKDRMSDNGQSWPHGSPVAETVPLPIFQAIQMPNNAIKVARIPKRTCRMLSCFIVALKLQCNLEALVWCAEASQNQSDPLARRASEAVHQSSVECQLCLA